MHLPFHLIITCTSIILPRLCYGSVTIIRQAEGDKFSSSTGLNCDSYDAKPYGDNWCICQSSSGENGTFLSEFQGSNRKCFYDETTATGWSIQNCI